MTLRSSRRAARRLRGDRTPLMEAAGSDKLGGADKLSGAVRLGGAEKLNGAVRLGGADKLSGAGGRQGNLLWMVAMGLAAGSMRAS